MILLIVEETKNLVAIMKQSEIIAKHVSKGYTNYKWNQFDIVKSNIEGLKSEIKQKSGAEVTTLSKQIIKTHIAEWFVKNIPMSNFDVECAVGRCREIFKEELGNEPAKYILRAGYAKWLIKQSNEKLDYLFLETALASCQKIFKEKFDPHEPAKKILMEGFVKWMTMTYTMSEVDVNTVQWRCQQLSGQHLTKEPAKLMLEAHYVDFARKRGDSIEIVKANYSKLFGETFVGFYIDGSHVSNANSGHFSSSNPDLEGYAKESATLPAVGVSAGDLGFWDAANQTEESDAVTKEMLKGCINGLLPPYNGSDYITAGLIVGGIKKGIITVLKGSAAEVGIMCGGGIIDQAKANLAQCGQLVCDRESSYCGPDRECGPSGSNICRANSSFDVDTIGKDSSSSSSSSGGGDCIIC